MADAAQIRGRFLDGSTMGHVVRMTMTGAMGITFVFVVDAANLFWIGLLGDPQLMAALGFAFAIQFFSVSSGVGLMIASTALISRSIGAGDRASARQQATAAALIAAAAQFTIAGLIVLFRHEILRLSGATGDTAALAARYLAVTLPSLGIMAVGLIANGALRAEGDGRRSMQVTLLSGLVAMVLDPLLIYGLGWGLDGAAAGLVIFRCVMTAMALRYAIGVHDLMARPELGALRRVMRPYLAIALPAVLTQLATPSGNYLLTRAMAGFGDDAMAGWAVVGRLTVVAFGGIFSLAGAIGGIFGQNFGACAYDRVERTFRDALLFGLLYALATWALLALSGPSVVVAFGLTGLAAEVVLSFTRIGAGAFVFASALFVSNAAFNALGRPARSTGLNWFRDGIITLPLALWVSAHFGAVGVIYAQALAGALMGMVAAAWCWRFVHALRRRAVPPLDLAPARSYAHADRFRRR
ncbi:putative efflux protein, MATE family [Cribrihabitans marinus]|uniref:Multidrug-efflux transporter n=1 Tax=Cribrihabitans marinus TaxID=1227549 RepID=A0A1H7ANB5_9RHOB|nr:MATE family efflux transporter [Cribrihabitans marinus]GGH31829.1 MATE family efflux transporter [Cribrihabitans marinus]SEJ65357.1 putative efflux protein, MATE family [Cribrihabitans marinus]